MTEDYPKPVLEVEELEDINLALGPTTTLLSVFLRDEDGCLYSTCHSDLSEDPEDWTDVFKDLVLAGAKHTKTSPNMFMTQVINSLKGDK